MQHLDEPTLRDILPQHYMENYRAAWWILRYGWVPALALMLLVAVFPALALWTAFRIRNGLGRLVSFSAGLLFSLQTAVYLLEGLGFQFGGFPNLPFVAEGTISIYRKRRAGRPDSLRLPLRYSAGGKERTGSYFFRFR